MNCPVCARIHDEFPIDCVAHSTFYAWSHMFSYVNARWPRDTVKYFQKRDAARLAEIKGLTHFDKFRALFDEIQMAHTIGADRDGMTIDVRRTTLIFDKDGTFADWNHYEN